MHASLSLVFGFFFCFKQKTAYEMRISDWSSDVCSSDLGGVDAARPHLVAVFAADADAEHQATGRPQRQRGDLAGDHHGMSEHEQVDRSEERREGKERVSPCRSRWTPRHSKKKSRSR